MQNLKQILTKDGSYTLLNEKLNETYHSINGAVAESMHVFIQNGLFYAAEKKKSLTLLEVGFGTGLNALLTYIAAADKKTKLHYVALEPFPVEIKKIKLLNIPATMKKENLSDFFYKMHHSLSGEIIILDKNFSFEKHFLRVEDFYSDFYFDLVYYDAFSPSVQPEMWTLQAFQKINNLIQEEGSLVTYCAKGEVKRTLRSVGFYVETLPGANGKREMIRAIKEQHL